MSCKPQFDVPSGAVAQVSIIDSTLRFSKMQASYLLEPSVESFDEVPTMYTWSFLIESSNGSRALFDLGVPPDINSYSPAIVKKLESSGWDVNAEKHVADIISENGIDPGHINSVIWSHYHWDHIGDIKTFPLSTELVIGPGFKERFLPAWPTNPDSPLREDYFTGRQVREISFSNGTSPIMAGPLRAFDFFGDGSFFLLDTPGHATGHLGGLVRTTTNPDTFIFMGGDLCHHGAEIRPSRYLPYPSALPLSALEALQARTSVCPGADLFSNLNVQNNRAQDEPLFDPAIGDDKALAIKTIKETQEADVQDNVFFIWAHDTGIRGVVDQFPLKANEWKAKGWREKVLWSFLDDLVPAALAAAQP